jgi:RNA polymerase sigma-70 factor (ECF subfamily)
VTDAELVDRARLGDAGAFGELVDRHRSAVYRAALAALRSPADAEDAAQEAFLLAYRRLSSFRGQASFKTWLLTIAWHQAINHRRGIGRWRRLIGEMGGAGPAGAGPVAGCEARDGETGGTDHQLRDRSPEQLLAATRLERDIERAIRGLSPKLRDPLLLAQAGEYTYDEIGRMLKVPIGTIKWRVSEARRAVRARLRQYGYTDVG